MRANIPENHPKVPSWSFLRSGWSFVGFVNDDDEAHSAGDSYVDMTGFSEGWMVTYSRGRQNLFQQGGGDCVRLDRGCRGSRAVRRGKKRVREIVMNVHATALAEAYRLDKPTSSFARDVIENLSRAPKRLSPHPSCSPERSSLFDGGKGNLSRCSGAGPLQPNQYHR